MAIIAGSPIEKSKIKTYGISGTFVIGGEKKIVVRYFNTVASNKNESQAGNSLDLLKELKPMRERVDASALRDLSTLLQRDLSDKRVAIDLIPYLRGEHGNVGFFPGILVALVPKGFFTHETVEVNYPTPDEIDNNTREYGKYWELENYNIGEVPTSIGQLKVDPENTDLIVLDGQHRANAFRFMTGTFDAAQDEDSIYSVFYPKVEGQHDFGSELPVTIVWFEAHKNSEDKISPIMITRRLFVDVNTTAKKVSDARNILLNDSHVPSIAVSELYSLFAENGFEADKFSLLHSSFDCGNDNRKDMPVMAIVSPTEAHFMMCNLLYAPDGYDRLDRIISADMTNTFKNNPRLTKIIGPMSTDELADIERGEAEAVKKIRTKCEKTVCKYVFRVLSEFNLYQPVLKGTISLSNFIESEGDTTQRTVWKKVFCGGEGLYDSFNSIGPKDSSYDAARIYKSAISTCTTKFRGYRNAAFSELDDDDIHEAYRTFLTKAGLAGLFMALSQFAERDGWSDKTVTHFLKCLNEIKKESWVKIFAIYKPLVVPNLDPKLWPDVRNIVLRSIQSANEEEKFFKGHSPKPTDPDVKAVLSEFKTRYKNWKREQAEESATPSDSDRDAWFEASIKKLRLTLSKCDLDEIFDEAQMKVTVLNDVFGPHFEVNDSSELESD